MEKGMSGEQDKRDRTDDLQGLGAVNVALINLLIDKNVITREEIAAALRETEASVKKAGVTERFIEPIRYVETQLTGWK